MNITGGADFPGNREGQYCSQVVEMTNGSFLMYGETLAGPGAIDQRQYQEARYAIHAHARVRARVRVCVCSCDRASTHPNLIYALT